MNSTYKNQLHFYTLTVSYSRSKFIKTISFAIASKRIKGFIQFSSVRSLSCVWLFVTSWIAAYQASLSITNFQSLLKLMSIELVMPSNHLILCRPLLLLSSIFPSIRVFSSLATDSLSVLHITWPKYWSFSFSISPSNEYSGLISLRIDWFARLNQGGKRCVPLKTTSHQCKELNKTQTLCVQAVEGSLWLKLWAWAD